MAGSNLLENSQRKSQVQKDYKKKTIPFTRAVFEVLGSTNKNGYLCGNKLTRADLAFVNWINMITSCIPAILDKFPSLKKLKETVETLSKIAKWLKERPETEFWTLM